MKKFLFILAFSCSLFISKYSFCQWQLTNEPYDTVACLAIKGDNMIVGIQQGHMYLSTDLGDSWNAVNNGIPNNIIVNSLAVSDGNIFAGTNLGVFLSTNNGVSWVTVNNGLTNLDVHCLASRGDSIFAGTWEGGGVFLSTNNGANWSSVGLSSNTFIESLAINGENVFAGTSGGVFLSTNNGTTWKPVNNGLSDDSTIVLSIAISGVNIFAGSFIGDVYLSTNNGSTWKAVLTSGLTDTYAIALAVSGKNIFVGNGNGLYLSTNNGTSWKAKNNGILIYPEPAILLLISGEYIYAGIQGEGLYMSSLSEMLGINELSTNNEQLSTKITPNPVNQSATINYQLPAKENITIKIYDITGREITTLLNEVKEKGDYNLIYNTANLNSGIYLLKAQTNTEIRISKFIKE